jgi:hypothetical protein
MLAAALQAQKEQVLAAWPKWRARWDKDGHRNCWEIRLIL